MIVRIPGPTQANVLSGDESTLRSLVEAATEIARHQFPADEYPWFVFESELWNVTRMVLTDEQRALADVGELLPKGRRARFLVLDSETVPLHPAFASALKAWLILRRTNADRYRQIVHIMRFLLSAIDTRLGGEEFRWHLVQLRDFEAAESLMISRPMSATVVSSAALYMRQFGLWLSDNELCNEIDWTPKTPVPGRNRYRTEEGRALRRDRLPTRRAIEGLAQIYLQATDSWDRLLICAMGIQLLCGFRTGELLTLPSDPIVDEDYRGRTYTCVRYWPLKARGGRQWATRRMSPLGAILLREIVTEILSITQDPREQAKRIRLASGRVEVPRPDFEPGLIARDDVAWAIGTTPANLATIRTRGASAIKIARRACNQKMGPTLFHRASVEDFLTKEQGPLPTVFIPGGGLQHLDECLFVLPRNLSFRGSATPCGALVDLLDERQLRHFLCGLPPRPSGATPSRRAGVPSVFQRFNIFERPSLNSESVEKIEFRPSMLRHFMNTISHRAGMSAFQITLWMNRASVAQTMPYLHDELYAHSASEIGEVVREMVARGALSGPIQDTFNALPEDQRDAFLDTIEVANKLPDGICVITHLPNCPRDRACALDCPFHLTDPRDTVRSSARATLTQANSALGVYQLARGTGLNVHPRLTQNATTIKTRLQASLGDR